jgi:hypothetical protein
MPVYIMLVIDGEGLSEIVAIFIVSEETNLVITSAVESFKKRNPAKYFPDSKLHTLHNFHREVTTDKKGISTDERIRCLEIVTQIVYSNSPAEYDHHVQELRDTKLQSAIFSTTKKTGNR